ncbi:MAG TPA: L,D-transpeptidase family protein [Ignavibacteriaceae bacterium]|nr:L,D-transpeptidase family protein [Ignavibacteriaceae bacterium]
MSYCKIILFLLLFIISHAEPQSFSSQQKRNTRVRDAYSEKENVLKENLRKFNLRFSDLNILLIAYKDESDLELWVRDRNGGSYNLLTTYKICQKSGELGPKRQQGDFQVPEGFYYINDFNPASKFYLSLGINYPNKSDEILSPHKDKGNAIYIHGSCVTIGCLPMTNNIIKEIYIYAVESKSNGQNNIPVYIFPCRLENSNFDKLKNKYKTDLTLLDFWKNLKEGYDKFQLTKKELRFETDKTGRYIFK